MSFNHIQAVVTMGNGDVGICRLGTRNKLMGVALTREKRGPIGRTIRYESRVTLGDEDAMVALFFDRSESVQVLIDALQDVKASLLQRDADQ